MKLIVMWSCGAGERLGDLDLPKRGDLCPVYDGKRVIEGYVRTAKRERRTVTVEVTLPNQGAMESMNELPGWDPKVNGNA